MSMLLTATGSFSGYLCAAGTPENREIRPAQGNLVCCKENREKTVVIFLVGRGFFVYFKQRLEGVWRYGGLTRLSSHLITGHVQTN